MNLLASIAVAFALLQAPPPPPAIPATFTGVFKSIESGRLVVEIGEGKAMRMFMTRSTKFVRDGKTVKASDFHDGDPVEVQAQSDAAMNMVALRVEAVKAKPPAPN